MTLSVQLKCSRYSQAFRLNPAAEDHRKTFTHIDHSPDRYRVLEIYSR